MKKIFTFLFFALFSVFCVAQSPIINKHFPSMHDGIIWDFKPWGEKHWMMIKANSSPSFKISDARLYKLALNGDEVWSKPIGPINAWTRGLDYSLPLNDGRIILNYSDRITSCSTKERMLLLDSLGQVLIDYSDEYWVNPLNIMAISNQEREIAILERSSSTSMNILRISINNGKIIKSTPLDFDSLPAITLCFSSELDSNRFFLANDQAIYVVENGISVKVFPLQRSAPEYNVPPIKKISGLDKILHCSHLDNSIAMITMYDKDGKTDSILCHTHQYIVDANEKEVLTIGEGSKIYSLETKTLVDSFRLAFAPLPYRSADSYNNYRMIGDKLLLHGVRFGNTKRLAILMTVDRTTKWHRSENNISITSFQYRAEDISAKWLSKVPPVVDVYVKNLTIGIQNNNADTLRSFYVNVDAYKNTITSADLLAPCITDSTTYTEFKNLSIPPGGIFTFEAGPFWKPGVSLSEPEVYIEVGAPNGKPDVNPYDNFKYLKLDFDMIPYPNTFLYWPNPVRDELTITVPVENLYGIFFEVYSVNGTQIFSGLLKPDDEDYYHFDTSYLGAGIYFFRAGKDRGRFVKM